MTQKWNPRFLPVFCENGISIHSASCGSHLKSEQKSSEEKNSSTYINTDYKAESMKSKNMMKYNSWKDFETSYL